MNVNIVRALGFLTVAVVLSLTACGKRQVADPPADIETTQAMETMSDTELPTVESSGLETPRTGDDKVAVSLPGLPVGLVDDVDDSQVEQCVVVAWLGTAPVPDGVSVAVTGVHFDPTGVFEEVGGCGGADECTEPFAFTSAGESCSVLVRALASDGDSTRLLLSGSALCVSQEVRKCRDVAATSSGQSISLSQPYEEPSEEETSPSEPTETTTTS